jgi:hypothetical protein
MEQSLISGGGDSQEFYKFIAKTLLSLTEEGLNGTVYVAFTVEKRMGHDELVKSYVMWLCYR